MIGQQRGAVYGNDDIDVIEILRLLWQKKWLIFVMVLLTTSIGFLYTLMAKPVFEAKAYLLPPTVGDIAAFNHGRSNKKEALLKSFKIADVYAIFTTALLSQANKRIFFNEIYLPSLSADERSKASPNSLYKQFNSNVMVKEDARFVPVRFTVSVRSTSTVQAVNWLEHYLKWVKDDAVNKMMRILFSQNKSVAHDLEQRIEMVREIAKEQRRDRLSQLNEALNIANAIGLEKQDFSVIGHASMVSLDEPSLMYRRGSNALKAEIKNLNERQSDDAFTPQLRSLQGKLNLIHAFDVASEDVAVFRFDGNIDTADMPVMPKKRLIIAFSFMLGLLLSVSVVLVRVAFATHRREAQ